MTRWLTKLDTHK